MNLDQIKDFSRIGIPSEAIAAQDSIVSDQPQLNPLIKDAKISIINNGTLKKPISAIRVSRSIEKNNKTSIQEEFTFNPNDKTYYAEVSVAFPLFGQISYYGPTKKDNDLESNQFFNNFIIENNNNVNFKGSWPNASFVRASFPSGYGNTNNLNGLYNQKGTLKNTTYQNLQNIFSGKKTLMNSKDFRLWDKNRLPGENQALQLNNFYISYPNTVSVWNYNGYEIPTKITTLNDGSINQDLEGLILISTGSQSNEKICYISPHSAATGLANTVVYINKTISKPGDPIQYQKIPSGMMIRSIIAGSEYQSGIKVFPSGVFQIEQTGENILTNRFYTTYTNNHIKQNTPIRDTAFYEMYSGLYNGLRQFNAGTWDGIIPARTPFKIELINCINGPEQKVGTDNYLYIVYSGYGSYNQIDNNIYNLLSYRNSNANKFNNTYIKINNNLLSSIGRGRDKQKNIAYEKALINAKYLMFNKFSNIIKNNIPEILFKNRKLRRFLKFLNRNKKYIGI